MQKPLAELLTETKTQPLAVRDIVTLAKPRITLMVVITAAGGLFLSQRAAGLAAPLTAATIVPT